MKQVLLYSGIYDFVAEYFIEQLNDIPIDEDITVRINSPGGNVFAGWGMIAAINERKGNVYMKVDGNASSMAFYIALYGFKVEALDVTKFLLHRADGYVRDETDQKFLDGINKDLRAKLEKRIDKKIFKDVTGIDFNQIFDSEKRIDVWISAKDAKKIGLVDKVVRLDPKEIEAINTNLVAFSNTCVQGSTQASQGGENKENSNKENKINNKKTKKMTIQELKASHPELFAEVIKKGADAEKERVQAWLAFKSIDMKAVENGIESNALVTQKVMAEMTVKMQTVKTVKDVKSENTQEINTKKETPEATTEEKEFLKAEAEALEAIGLIK